MNSHRFLYQKFKLSRPFYHLHGLYELKKINPQSSNNLSLSTPVHRQREGLLYLKHSKDHLNNIDIQLLSKVHNIPQYPMQAVIRS